MTKLLRIDASARTTRSLTRALADRFERNWLDRRPQDEVVHRDVGSSPPPFVSEEWVAAAFAKDRTKEEEQVLALSDELIAEVADAQIIVIASPMYNFGMPASLKAWVDQIVRINKTFTFDLARGDAPLEPVYSGKTLVLLTAWGEFGFGPGEPNEGRDNLTPHIRTVSRYLGVEELHHVGIEYQEFGDLRFEASKKEAFASLAPLVDRLVCQSGRDAQDRKSAA